jgi:hypothetical protein
MYSSVCPRSATKCCLARWFHSTSINLWVCSHAAVRSIREQMLLTLSCCHLLSFKYITQTDLFEVSPSYLQITLQILRWIYFIICGMFVPPHRFPRDKVNKRKHDPAACNSASCIASTSQHYGSPSLVEIQLVHWNYLQIILQSSGNHLSLIHIW